MRGVNNVSFMVKTGYGRILFSFVRKSLCRKKMMSQSVRLISLNELTDEQLIALVSSDSRVAAIPGTA